MNLQYAAYWPILMLLPLIAVAMVLAIRSRQARVSQWISLTLWNRVVFGVRLLRRYHTEYLLFFAALSLIIAVLRPQYGVEYDSVQTGGQSVMVALDTSQSMDARDLPISRLEFAKQDIGALVDQLVGDRIGLIAFEGTAMVECPFTIDGSAARLFVDDIQTNELPIPGTNLAAAIREAIRAFNTVAGRRTLVIFSDGESFDGNTTAAAIDAKDAGIVIHTVGIGGTAATPIPIGGDDGAPEGVKVDRNGKTVITRLNDRVLREVATITGGQYIPVKAGQNAAPRLMVLLGKTGDSDLTAYLLARHHDRYLGFAVSALAFLLGEIVVSTGIRWRRSS